MLMRQGADKLQLLSLICVANCVVFQHLIYIDHESLPILCRHFLSSSICLLHPFVLEKFNLWLKFLIVNVAKKTAHRQKSVLSI